jgi:Fe2+ or Zn2+ uptake regulation protein
MTPQRLRIIEALDKLESHPTAEELFTIASRCDPSLNLSTVYRTLNWLEAEGLVSARHFSEDRGAGRFDAASPVEHHHFICSQCKRVIEFEDPGIAGLKRRFAGERGCQVDTASVELYGLCPECLEKKPNRQEENFQHELS